ncbi:MAG: poly-gamma-glutamate hydrolase family protein [Mycobacterium sp.]
MSVRHLYFAYGSNLCVEQMARRCPEAGSPRPATLADHDWLINERGVATVEPFVSSRVHGVIWDVSDRDLATLDSAEGVPVRYRRDRLTLDTDTGPTQAWVYIDHRVEPGAPRPGYLERVIDGALHHGLPERWVEFLRRWDPIHWPRKLGPAAPEAPSTLAALLSEAGVRETSTLRSDFGFMAIHGGGLERMTDVIAQRAADAVGASVYVVQHPDHYPHHLGSARFSPADSPRLRAFLEHVDTVVSLHGYGRIGRSTHLLAGGGNRALAAHLGSHVEVPGYQLITDLNAIPPELRGLHPDNPANLPRRGGVQLELPPRVRGISPRSAMPGDDGLCPATSALIQGLIGAARSWSG